MTVGQLITRLKKIPARLEVFVLRENDSDEYEIVGVSEGGARFGQRRGVNR